ncbi:hypothetical protein Y1Q_0004143 [Alligator mississippiensis]|uniref:Uncharacterized protein n=1 Tax=Alligator mississippiensis TaxID=8496 RepID=A0A151PIB9_ALLMI|nr:hypothetical protein Y1Q_0004143 [Alligator mississippiensis]
MFLQGLDLTSHSDWCHLKIWSVLELRPTEMEGLHYPHPLPYTRFPEQFSTTSRFRLTNEDVANASSPDLCRACSCENIDMTNNHVLSCSWCLLFWQGLLPLEGFPAVVPQISVFLFLQDSSRGNWDSCA